MSGEERRKLIIDTINNAEEPVSGGMLGKLTGVSRQVVVQDIALLRAQSYPILATNRGYILDETNRCTRVLKLRHRNEQTEDELQTIVDLGGTVIDVIVNHRIYGKVRASLNIRNRRDVTLFLNDIKSGKSTPLMNVTSGYHFHTIGADSQEVLDEIEQALREKKYLADILPYETDI